MFTEIKKELLWNGKILSLRTGKIAMQADGAVLAQIGDSIVLATVVAAKEAKEGIDFFPLTVTYLEKAYAAGRIPGGFMKRESKPSENEVLISRMIDRPLRPLFDENFRNETQVVCTVLSYDENVDIESLSLIACSAALAISGLPYLSIVAGARIGYDGTKYLLNPVGDDLKSSKLNLFIAGTKDSINMVESSADELSSAEILDAIKFGHAAILPIISFIDDLAKLVNKPKISISLAKEISSLEEDIYLNVKERILNAYSFKAKLERKAQISKIKQELKLSYDSVEDASFSEAFARVEYRIMREQITNAGLRIDGRSSAEIRPIFSEISLLPRVHGSALFTRGETQVIAAATLGTAQDEQIHDSLDGGSRASFALHYNFPSYSVGESGQMKPPGRREIGHGKLAWRALSAVMPSKESFPYTVRVVSEVTSCNGSSSMATVCGASLSLMDAGVPIKSAVAGIAMGLIKSDDKFVILSDIMGDEDHLGDMDFKLAGTKSGITALQMDIKISQISFEIIEKVLSQGVEGKDYILGEMAKTISSSKPELSSFAPTIITIKIDKSKIRDLIGPGGKIIKEICEVTGAKIDINDEGTVNVSAVGKKSIDHAKKMIMDIVFEPELGVIYDGTVTKILESGAFVNIMGTKDGFVHISEIMDMRINAVSEHLKEGDKVKVKMLGIDNRGKPKLSIKQANMVDSANSKASASSAPVDSDGNSGRKIRNNSNSDAGDVNKSKAKEDDNLIERKYFS